MRLYGVFKIIARLSPRAAFLMEYLFYYLVIRLNNPDACLVSYPKCGRTWVHYALINYYKMKYGVPPAKKIYHMSKKDKRIPLLVFTHDGKRVNFITRSKRLYKKQKVILLFRNPGDVVISYYYHNRFRDRIYRKDLSHFIRDRNFGVKNIVEFYNSWIDRKKVPKDLILVSYEGLKKNTFTEMKRILRFVGEKDIDEKLLGNAVRKSSFSRMKSLEKKGKIRLSGLTDKVLSDREMKVRKGSIGGYRKEFSQKDRDYVEKVNSGLRQELKKLIR